MKKTLQYIVSFCFLIPSFLMAGEHSFSIKFEINETGINRALQHQYNQANFPSIVNGSLAGVNYTLYLDLPTIILQPNVLKIRMVIDIVSSIGNYSNIVVEPTVNIPEGSISTDQVAGVLTNLPNVVQAIPGIHQTLKDAIVLAYNSFEPWIYPSKLVNAISNSSLFLKQRNVDITNLILGWQVAAANLTLVVTTNLNSSKPFFYSALIRNYQGNDYIGVLSNIYVRIDEIRLYTLSGSFLWSGQPKDYCEKDSEKWFNMGSIGLTPSCYIAKILFAVADPEAPIGDDPTTFYMRYYGCINSGNWSGHTDAINN